VVCTLRVQPKNVKITKQAMHEAQGVSQHLSALASEMNITNKLPRFLFWKKHDVFKSYAERKEMFKMFAHMSIMRLMQKVA
jgi:hypothetical protein